MTEYFHTPRFITAYLSTGACAPSWDAGVENIIQPWYLDIESTERFTAFYAIHPSGEKFAIGASDYRRAVRQCHNGIVVGRMSFVEDEVYFTTRDIDEEPTGGVGEIVLLEPGELAVNAGEMMILDIHTGEMVSGQIYVTTDSFRSSGKVTRYSVKTISGLDIPVIMATTLFIKKGFLAVRGEMTGWHLEQSGQPFTGDVKYLDLRLGGWTRCRYENGKLVGRIQARDYDGWFSTQKLDIVIQMRGGEELRGVMEMRVLEKQDLDRAAIE